MDNQQAIQWLAGFFEGEGCVSFNLRSQRDSKLTPWTSISNTSLTAIQECERILKYWNVYYTVRCQVDKRPNTKPCYHIRVHGVENVHWFLRNLHPYLECESYRVSRMLHFCDSRLGRKGHASTNDLEWQMYQEILNWRASTTTCEESYKLDYDWLAGVWEAEGTFSANQNGTPIIQLVNCNTKLIDKARVHLPIGCHLKRYQIVSHHQPIWHLTLCGQLKLQKFEALVGAKLRYRKSELDRIKI